jgi:hypothetical protein
LLFSRSLSTLRPPVTVRTDYRPYSGSCPRCLASLGLASLQSRGVWYCSPACASGAPAERAGAPAVDERWLTNRPRRFHRKRSPKELRRSSR